MTDQRKAVYANMLRQWRESMNSHPDWKPDPTALGLSPAEALDVEQNGADESGIPDHLKWQGKKLSPDQLAMLDRPKQEKPVETWMGPPVVIPRETYEQWRELVFQARKQGNRDRQADLLGQVLGGMNAVAPMGQLQGPWVIPSHPAEPRQVPDGSRNWMLKLRGWLSYLETLGRRKAMQCPGCHATVIGHGEPLGPQDHAQDCPLVLFIIAGPGGPMEPNRQR